MIQFDALDRFGVVAAMSEKTDGDFSLRDPATVDAARKARLAFCRHLGLDARELVCPQQVHRTAVARVGEGERGRGALAWDTGLPSTDGLVSCVPGLPMAILTADCVPIYLFDAHHRVGGLIHAGHQGTQRNIAGRAIRALHQYFNTSPETVHAVVGPSAGPCCYQVSREAADAFARLGLPTTGRNLDLWQANADQLAASGVPRRQISIIGTCTICDVHFHSYRRGAAERNIAVISL
ncbi:MAG TPA: laccase domain-containing protein [Candidatus Hydrogenedentes bacterium]|nr:laccase domain-containing protein [Candidatus Hydrogenedentota bacterium]